MEFYLNILKYLLFMRLQIFLNLILITLFPQTLIYVLRKNWDIITVYTLQLYVSVHFEKIIFTEFNNDVYDKIILFIIILLYKIYDFYYIVLTNKICAIIDTLKKLKIKA